MFVESAPDYVHIILMIITETFCVYSLSEDLLSTKLRKKFVCHQFPLLYGWFKVTMLFSCVKYLLNCVWIRGGGGGAGVRKRNLVVELSCS